MGYRTKTPLPAEFGHGGDGDLHITSDASIAQPEYNLASLTIDAGAAWSVPVFSAGVFFPIVTIRCQTPIVLNGTISAEGVLWGWNTSDCVGYDGASIVWEVGGGMVPVPAYPVCGGHCRGGESSNPTVWGNHYPYPQASGNAYDNGSTILGSVPQDVSELVGPGRWFRYALGAGGSIYHGNYADYTRASHGGGALRIFAPEIQFGANGRITADGGDGAYCAEDDGGGNGGGGGGYVELLTAVPVDGTYSWDKDNPTATGDRAKVTATGGSSTDANGTVVRDASNRAGYIGMAGVVNFLQVGGA